MSKFNVCFTKCSLVLVVCGILVLMGCNGGEGPEPLHPHEGRGQPVRLEAAGADAPLAALAHEPGPTEDLKVLRDGGERHRQGLGERAHPLLAVKQHAQDRPPRRIGKRCEDQVQIGLGRSIHGGTLSAPGPESQPRG